MSRLGHHDINMFINSRNFKMADWGMTQETITIECETSDGESQFFFVGGPFEHFSRILMDDRLVQEVKDIHIQGILRGILFAMENITCHDSFIYTQ